MKKFTVLFSLVLCMILFQVALGQAPKFGVGGIIGFPMGDFKDYAGSVTFGGTAQVLLPVGDNLAVGAQAGYLTFGKKTQEMSVSAFGITATAKAEYKFTAIPIQAIGRYYFGVPGGPRPFVGAAVGVHILTVDVTASYSTNIPGLSGEVGSSSESKTGVSIAPTIGIEVGSLEISAFYQYIGVKVQAANIETLAVQEFHVNYVGARIGVNFGG